MRLQVGVVVALNILAHLTIYLGNHLQGRWDAEDTVSSECNFPIGHSGIGRVYVPGLLQCQLVLCVVSLK